MVAVSYISIIERYHDYREAIRELLASILTGIGHTRICTDPDVLAENLRTIRVHYPFVDLLYTLDIHGTQSSPNIRSGGQAAARGAHGRGADRSQRPYYQLARASDQPVVTEPYLSSASRNLCISAALRCQDADGRTLGYVVIDIDLSETIEFLMGDAARRKFVPAFRVVYSLIVVGLFAVVCLLLYTAYTEIFSLTFAVKGADTHLQPFGIIIFLTLALAIFDLGKTILEEEVLMHKDIFRHSSTRRTITRFVAAILIAVSIEALLLMFKAALGVNGDILSAVAMMLTAVGLLVGLGIYVYLGARAEAILRGTPK